MNLMEKFLYPLVVAGVLHGCSSPSVSPQRADEGQEDELVGCSEIDLEDEKCAGVENLFHETIERFQRLKALGKEGEWLLVHGYTCGSMGPLTVQVAEMRARTCTDYNVVARAITTADAIRLVLIDECGFVGEISF